MSASRNLLRSTAVAVVAAATLSGCAVGLQDLPVNGLERNSFDVTAELVTADGIVAGADVRHGQQVVGRVTDIALQDDTAAVTMSLSEGTDLPANVAAHVEIPSALGTPFIRLTSPEDAQGQLSADTVIPMSSTSVGPQVESMLAAMGNLFGGSGVSQLQSVMASLNTAFEDRSDKVGDLIDTLNRLLSKASAYSEDFNAAIVAANDVSEMLVAQQHLVEQFFADVPKAVDVLASQRDKIGRLMTQTTALAQNMDAIVDGRRPELNALVNDASTVIDSLSTFNDDVGQTLTNMNGFMANITKSIRGDYLVFDGALDIPGGIDKILTGGILASGQPLPTPKDLSDALTGGLASAREELAEKTAEALQGVREDVEAAVTGEGGRP